MKINYISFLLLSILCFVNPGCSDTINELSAVDFQVNSEKLKIISPVKGDKNIPGGLLKIRWLSNQSLARIDIYLLRSGELDRTLVLDQKNNGTFGWFIDEDIENSNFYSVKVVNSIQESNFSVSENFSIKKIVNKNVKP